MAARALLAARTSARGRIHGGSHGEIVIFSIASCAKNISCAASKGYLKRKNVIFENRSYT
jgi:hypothetical protein